MLIAVSLDSVDAVALCILSSFLLCALDISERRCCFGFKYAVNFLPLLRSETVIPCIRRRPGAGSTV